VRNIKFDVASYYIAAYGRQPSVVEADPFLAFSTEDIEGMDKEVANPVRIRHTDPDPTFLGNANPDPGEKLNWFKAVFRIRIQVDPDSNCQAGSGSGLGKKSRIRIRKKRIRIRNTGSKVINETKIYLNF